MTDSARQRPLGRHQHFCSRCGNSLRVEIPAGDHQLRYTCNSCMAVHYENPKIVVGCVPVHDNRILLCKRAIEPRLGYWTLPAGFMELGESLAQGAARETLEEACAVVTIESPLANVNVLSAGQVHVFFRASLADGTFQAGDESLDVALFKPDQIPWDELAFTSNRIALEQYLEQQQTGRRFVWTGNAL